MTRYGIPQARVGCSVTAARQSEHKKATKSTVRRMSNHSELWKNIPWKQLRKNLFRLQCRLWKAVQAGDKAKTLNLQKLILKSYAARMLAIRQVTQLNTGKRTAGIDGKASLSFKERFELETILKNQTQRWKHSRLREISIPKRDGTTRKLKVPTIKDRAWQCLVKYVLEPAHEATFHARSYGFRPGRSTHDAQKQLFNNLNSTAKGINKRVLELDIEKCFDRIDRNVLMEKVIAPQSIKQGIWSALKAGTAPEFPEQGVPQGGVVSPLLANIALNGIEDIHKCVRYADDMVYILKPEDDAEKILERIKSFLAQRGMKVKASKTRLVAATDGFDFLGWHFVVLRNEKFKSYPSEENYKTFRKKVKNIVNCSNYGAREKAKKLAPIVRGWRNYHRYCKIRGAKHSLWFLDNRAFKVFNKEKKLNRYQARTLVEKAFPQVGYAENKHVNVKGNKSPFDGDITYWSKRKSKYYDGNTARALRKQNHSCGYCGLKFADEEQIHLHHIDGNHDNWKVRNLMAIHESCHDYIHRSKTDCREPCAGKPARTDRTERGGVS